MLMEGRSSRHGMLLNCALGLNTPPGERRSSRLRDRRHSVGEVCGRSFRSTTALIAALFGDYVPRSRCGCPRLLLLSTMSRPRPRAPRIASSSVLQRRDQFRLLAATATSAADLRRGRRCPENTGEHVKKKLCRPRVHVIRSSASRRGAPRRAATARRGRGNGHLVNCSRRARIPHAFRRSSGRPSTARGLREGQPLLRPRRRERVPWRALIGNS